LLADIALKDAQFRALGKLPQRNYESSYNWVWNRKPFGPGRYEYIFHQDDFVSLAGRSENEYEIVNFVESLLDVWFSCLKVCHPEYDCILLHPVPQLLVIGTHRRIALLQK
jgi:hypothetical protein